MNYLTNMKNVTKLSQQELQNTSKSSWHDQYKASAWIFIGGLPYDLTEGDIICIFSQYGEIVNINLIRAKDTGQSKGFCFLCYEDQRSTILAVDNFNGITILNRKIRVDHVQNYKVPKGDNKTTEETRTLYTEGCAPKPACIVPKIELSDEHVRETLADQIEGDIKLPARLPIYTNIKEEKKSDTDIEKISDKKNKKEKRTKKPKLSESNSSESELEVKREIRTSLEREHNITEEKRERNKYTNKFNYDKNSDSRFNKLRNDRSRSRDRDIKSRNYKKDVSPSIPKRWR